MFKETKDGETHYCTHTKDNSICDKCLGKVPQWKNYTKGASEWKQYGMKYGYWEYFKDEMDGNWTTGYNAGYDEATFEVKKEIVEDLEEAKLNIEATDFINAINKIINKLK